MRKTKLLGLGLVLCGAFCFNAEAKLFKWVDDSGTTHYGETIPPEYANKDASRLSDKGRVEKRIERLTPEEKQAKEAAVAKKNADQQASVEAKRKDAALLGSYSNEKEIDLARDRALQQVQARVDSYTTISKSAQDSLTGLRKEQADKEKLGRKIPNSLLEDIAEGEARVAKTQKDLAQSEQEMVNVKARFEADKVRFRELKGLEAGK
jgi:hypothetical protein